MDTIWEVGKIILPLGIGYFFGNLKFKRTNRFDKIKEQISKFYSPMISCLNEIRAKAEIRNKINDANEKYFSKPRDLKEEQFYFKSIEYENEKFRTEIIPLYEKMLNIFNDNLHLAEKSTQSWHKQFSQFVDVWHRYLDKTLRYETIKRLDIKEEKLKPFYYDLDRRLEELQRKILK